MIRFIFIFLLAVSAVGQDVVINDFSGGLATKPGIFHVKPNQARECLNWDLSEKPGVLTIRNGYAPVGYKNDTNSFLSIYGHYYRDGRKEVFGVAKSDSASWGTLYRSGNHRIVIDTTVKHFLYTGAEWSWCSWKDKVVLANGRQKPLIWNGDDCRPLTLYAPGEFLFTPVVHSSGHLNGEYRYVVMVYGESAKSYISPPITAYNEAVVIHGFQGIAPDSVNGIASTISFMIGRTKASTHSIMDTMPFYSIRYWDQTGPDSGYFKDIPISALDTLTWTDTVGDSNFVGSAGNGFTQFTTAYMNEVGRVGGSFNLEQSFGRPTYAGYDTTSADLMGLVQPTGWKLPEDTSSTILATCYMVTYFDSTNGIESDSGRTLFIKPEAQDTAKYYKIGLPPQPSGDTVLQRILYKTFKVERMSGVPDSIYIKQLDIWIDREEWEQFNLYTGLNANVLPWGSATYDTIYASNGFKRLAVITGSDSIYVDSVRWDSLSQQNMFYKAQVPNNLNHPFIHDDRIWGLDGSRLYYSFLDSIGYWGAFKNFAFNLDDGDEATIAYPDRDNITVFKNHSQHTIYKGSDGKYFNKWIVRGRGCVAPGSVEFYDGGIIYLAENGVFYETAAPAKDKGTDRIPLSDPIADLLDYPISSLDDAEGFIYEDKYLLSFPDKDTTYVYDFKSRGWYVWDFGFECAITYDTVFRTGLVPSSDMLFITGSDSAIYKFNTTQTDNGQAIVARWKSGPFAKSSRNVRIDKLGFWTDDNSSFSYVLYDAEDTAKIDSIKITPDDRYYLISPVINESNYFQLGITNLPDTSADLEINEIDIYVKPGTAEITH